MHAKVVTVDDLYSVAGSFNFDWFSGRRNLEVGAAIFSHDIAKQFKEMHLRKLHDGNNIFKTAEKRVHRATLNDWDLSFTDSRALKALTRAACAFASGTA